MDNEIIANIKSLGIDMINKAGVGHPGIVLSSAPIIYTLFSNHLNINPSDPHWINRDRFVLSCGHASALLYATLYMSGYSITLDDLKKFRHLNSKTPGHPELGVTPGVECSTGPLGQGIATAVGMALGEKIIESKHQYHKKGITSFKVYCLVSDGDLMEGIANEACSLAGALNLDNLIVLYDSNDVSLDGQTKITYHEDVCKKFKAMGWHALKVKRGNDYRAINRAINLAKKLKKPTIIECKTTLGEGSLKAGNNAVHGKPLDQDDIRQLKQKLNIPDQEFYVNENAKSYMINKIANRVNNKYLEWSNNLNNYINDELKGNKASINYLFNTNYNLDLINYDWNFPNNLKEATRDTNNRIMEKLATYIPMFIGGSADLGTSTKTYLEHFPNISASNYNGQNIWFGVREHAMGAILNGLALLNFKPYGSTFLCFSDYLKPAMRMSCLMNLPVVYIFSHDSINIGSDGPTHQPIEQLAMLHSMPNMTVYRPADAHELVGCWQSIINSKTNPSSLILSKAVVDLGTNTSATGTLRGGYILHREKKRIDAIIIASGSELSLAKNISFELTKQGYDFRVVSMPSIDLFRQQQKSYQEEVLPRGIKTIVIEPSSSYSWHQFVQSQDHLITLDQYGKSGTTQELLSYYQFDYESVKQKIIDILNK